MIINPILTSNNSDYGTMSASENNSSAFQVFDSSSTSVWTAFTTEATLTFTFFAAYLTAGAFTLTTDSLAAAPLSFVLEAVTSENVLTTWTTLGTYSSLTTGWTINTPRLFTIPSPSRKPYNAIRLRFTALNGGGVSITDWSILEPDIDIYVETFSNILLASDTGFYDTFPPYNMPDTPIALTIPFPETGGTTVAPRPTTGQLFPRGV